MILRLLPSMPPIEGAPRPGSSAAARRDGRPVPSNLSASWRLPCQAAHPLLTCFVAEAAIAVSAITHPDPPEDGHAWFADLRTPFAADGNSAIRLPANVFVPKDAPQRRLPGQEHSW